MAINETKNGTYRVRKKYPLDVALLLELKNPYFDKIFKTMKEAKEAELDFENKIQELRKTKDKNVFELGGEMLFKDFYESIWLDAYSNGSTSSYPTPPTKVTINNTKDVFRLHILPMFGRYSLNYLNQNKQFVAGKMTAKAREYANFKTLRSYVNQIFDLAEEYDYISYNRLSKTLKKIKALKKIQLANNKQKEDKYLSEEELIKWIKAIEEDYGEGLLTTQDYTLFWTTYLLSDRKSESYALQWKHIDFNNNQIYLEQALDKLGNVKSTKGNKKTIIHLPVKLKRILLIWKSEQKKELKTLEIEQTDQQFLFTYCDMHGNINKCVHTDFLNYRMKSVRKRHPELKPASPHKLRHTSATLAKKYGMTVEDISNGLTHSNLETIGTYLNNDKVVPLTPADYALNHLMQNAGGE